MTYVMDFLFVTGVICGGIEALLFVGKYFRKRSGRTYAR